VNDCKTSSNSGHKVCDKCCKKISELKCDTSNKQRNVDTDSDRTEQFAKITALQSLNSSLKLTDVSSIKKKRLCKGTYSTSKIKRIQNAVKIKTLNIPINVNFLIP
jgi:hypothetical protein